MARAKSAKPKSSSTRKRSSRTKSSMGEALIGAVFLALVAGAAAWWAASAAGMDPRSWECGLLAGLATGTVAGLLARSVVRTR